MHIPNEDGTAFVDDQANGKPIPDNAMMQQTHNLLAQQQQLARPPRSPRRGEHATAVHDEYFPSIVVVTENTPSVAGTGRRMVPDDFFGRWTKRV
ncbi:hypothetical protein PI124_g18472 [Phytophthora idaei]|nr:hypothetical protein PI125_g19620 [Phytophthora idaei]KAG3138767.1 hypothetical protein PI126_g16760 [Phytophthora idaei]KAG3236519.1 hypothetical protein PI124_g18472 [Phytophthora idaei]